MPVELSSATRPLWSDKWATLFYIIFTTKEGVVDGERKREQTLDGSHHKALLCKRSSDFDRSTPALTPTTKWLFCFSFFVSPVLAVSHSTVPTPHL